LNIGQIKNTRFSISQAGSQEEETPAYLQTMEDKSKS